LKISGIKISAVYFQRAEHAEEEALLKQVVCGPKLGINQSRRR
jgi:hypothetical protein